MKSPIQFMLATLLACCLLIPVSAMTRTHHDPADVAADEVVSLLDAELTAGTFEPYRTALNAATGDGLNLVTDDGEEPIVIQKRDVPLTYLSDLDDRLQISVMAGPEGARRKGDQISLRERFTIDLVVELHMDEGNSAGNPIMRTLSRHLSDIVYFQNPTDINRQRRRFTLVDAMVMSEQITARHDPAELAANSVFLSLRRFEIHAVT